MAFGLAWLSPNLQSQSVVPNSLVLVMYERNKGKTEVPEPGTGCRRQNCVLVSADQEFGWSRNSERKILRKL